MSQLSNTKANDMESPFVPRYMRQGYTNEEVQCRRQWLESMTDTSLEVLGESSCDGEALRGNIENPIGWAQVPIGIAGPMRVQGEYANGQYYVPLATTEGALVRSYERGMVAITRAGGAVVRIQNEGNRACPILSFDDVQSAHEFCTFITSYYPLLKSAAESTTRYGKLLKVEAQQIGRDVLLHCQYNTADAHGMNMIAKATQAICDFIASRFPVGCHYVLSGGSSEKRASASLFDPGKGKRVTAGVLLPAKIVQSYLKTDSAKIFHMWQRTLIAQLHAGVVGFNGHYANGLTAMFIACGQDVANVTNCAVGITNFDVCPDGSLYASVTLPSLTVGTVGGGTGLPTSRKCLEVLDCFGAGKSLKFAEIIAATLLAGELSFGAALASGGFVQAHETYGRNRPQSSVSESASSTSHCRRHVEPPLGDC